MNSGVLVLDAGMMPLGVVNPYRAVNYILSNKGYSLLDTEVPFRAARLDLLIPSIVVLSENHAHKGFKSSKPIRWSKRGVLKRDKNTCGYCGKHGDTVDHVNPKKLGGKNEWENTITACQPCNNRKDCKPLEKSGMKLLFQPYVPTYIKKRIPVNNYQRAWLVQNSLDSILD